MKYVVVLGDGMADYPIEAIDGKTPLEYANTPTMDKLAAVSEIGLVHTIPDGMSPGSDTANLSVIGYDPKVYYSGRSPLEALSIGVPMDATDIALRCNIITVSDDDVPYEDKTIIDHSSSEISTEDCAVLLEAVREQLENDIRRKRKLEDDMLVATTAIAVDATTGRQLYGKQEDRKIYPASTTKVLTALLVLENLEGFADEGGELDLDVLPANHRRF